MDLAHINSAAEQAFIAGNLAEDAWIGARDSTAEGAWRWADDNTQFWSGGTNGSAVGGLYSNWHLPYDPDNWFNQDCAAAEVLSSGKWADRYCSEALTFVCERALDTGEPGVTCDGGGPQGAAWPSFRRCLSHQAQSAVAGARKAEPLLTFETEDAVEGAAAIGTDGIMYVGSYDGYLYAIRPDLTLDWRFHTQGAVRSSPALAPDGTIYVGSSDGRLYAVNPDGSQKWSYLTAGAVRSSPTVGPDGTVYVGSDGDKFYAFSPTGVKLWSVNTIDVVRSSPAISPDGTVYVGSDDWSFNALAPDGTYKWTFTAFGPVTSSPSIGPDGTVYVGSYDGSLYALNSGNGSVKWSFTTGNPVTSSPAVAPDGSIVFGCDDGQVRALHPDGTLKWAHATGGAVLSSPAIDPDGVVYIGSSDNSIYALAAEDGHVLWSVATGGDVVSSPAIGPSGEIVAGSYDGELYVIGPGCSAAHRCDNAEGPCDGDVDCQANLVCGHGIAARYGLPTGAGVCWDPQICATLGSTDCGSPGAYCGTDCCLPQCGAAGSDNGCGGSCEACIAGADSDGDGISDCDEQNDQDGWTDPLLFNGVVGKRGDACGSTPACADIDTRAEIDACFAQLETKPLSSGWDFATSDKNVCDAGFDFQPQWQGCAEDFAVRYEGTIRLEQSGTHCFLVDGSQDNQCGALFFDQSTTALISGASPSCYTLPAGIYPIEWFYETTSSGQNELHLDYCFSSTTGCIPVQAIPAAMLRQASDSAERICAADSACSELCPCDVGGVCTSDLQCAGTLACKAGVAERFNQPSGVKVCWNDNCDDLRSPLFDCGHAGALCGPVCPSCTPDCTGKSCGYDGCWGTCGAQCTAEQFGCTDHADCADGLDCVVASSGDHVCLPESCAQPGLNPCSDPANAGQVTECGECPACTPDCDGRVCGDAPNGCGSCGSPALGAQQYCSEDGQVESTVFTDFVPFYSIPTEGLKEEDTAGTPGTVPGQFAVSDFGQATYTIPIQVAPGRGGIEPRLALAYDSAAGNGYLGMGWGLTGLSAINRCPNTIAQDGEAQAITFTTADRFCLDGNRLVQQGSATYGADGTEYRTEIQTFSRIVSSGGPDEPASFTVYAKDGRILTYDFKVGGNTALAETGIRDPNYTEPDPTQVRTQSWLLTEVEDRFGNAMVVTYTSPGSWMGATAQPGIHVANAVYGLGQNNTQPVLGGSEREYYPSRIDYTSHAGTTAITADRYVDFHYRQRHDVLAGYQLGARYERTQVLDTITAYAQGQTMFQYRLGYQEPVLNEYGDVESDHLHERTLLTSVQQCARATIDPANPDSDLICKPATAFEYDPAVTPGFGSVAGGPGIDGVDDAHADLVGRPLTLDLDGNGQDDVLYSVCSNGDCTGLRWQMILNGGSVQTPSCSPNCGRLTDTNGGLLPVTPATTFVVDYDLDGRDDVIEMDGVAGIRVWSYAGGQLVRSDSSLGSPAEGGMAYVLDVEGNGTPDLLVCKPVLGAKQFNGLGDDGPRKVVSTTWEAYLNDGHGFGGGGTMAVTTNGPGCQDGTPMDVNGDGKMELLLNTTPLGHMKLPLGPFVHNDASAVFWPLNGQVTDTAIPAASGDELRLVFDANGDGLADVIELRSDLKSVVWTNTGTGFVSSAESPVGLSSIDNAYSGTDFLRQVARFGIVFDENADGRMDLLVKANDSTWTILRSDGSSFDVVTSELPAGPTEGNHLFVYDKDHDGMADLAWNTGMLLRQGAAAWRMSRVTDGLGASTIIDYADLGADPDEFAELPQGPIYTHSTDGCSYPLYCRHPAGAVVRRTSLYAPELVRSFYYGYGSAAVELHGQGSLGFGQRTIVDGARNDLAAQYGGHHLIELTYDNKARWGEHDIHPFVGMVKTRVETAPDADGRVRTSTVERGLLDEEFTSSPGSVFAHVQTEERTIEEGSENAVLQHVTREWTYDDLGNLVGSNAQWDNGDEITTVAGYNNDAEHVSRWLISEPVSESVSATNESGTLQRVRTFSYAEDLFGSGVLPYTGRPEAIIVDPDSPMLLGTALVYNDCGNIEETAVIGSTVDGFQTRRTAIEFDSKQMFPARVTHFNYNDNTGHAVDTLYDQGLGALIGTSEVGLPNQTVERYAIPDGFGRIRRVVEPGASNVEISYQGEAPGLEMTTTQLGAPTTTVFYDALAREQVRFEDGFGVLLETDTQYNALGLVSAVSRPHVTSAPDADFTQQSYDALGRPLLTTLPDDNAIERCYFHNVSCTRNPRDNTSCTVSDDHGRLLHSIEPFAASTTCQDAAHEVDSSPTSDPGSHYGYDAFGALRSITDPAQNVTSFTRDAHGRVLTQQDPDSGSWSYTYNAFGERETEADPQSRQAVLRYDGLGRLISRTDLASAQGESDQSTVWFWDAPLLGTGFFGKLASTVSPDGVVASMTYDSAGRLKTYSRSMQDSQDEAQTLTREQRYDGYGRLAKLWWYQDPEDPDPLRVRYNYNAFGYLRKLSLPPAASLETPGDDASGDAEYWTAQDADAYGQLAHEHFGNGLVTQRTYKPHTGYLDLLKTGPNGEVQNRTHAYDENGNLQGRSDPNQLFAESYTYDALDRLTDVTGLILSTQVNLEHYDYDTLGNITSKSGTDLSTGNPYSMMYGYDDGTGRPHAVKSVSDGSTTQLYLYDDDGLRARGTELSALSIDYNRRHMPSWLRSTEDPAGILLYYDADGTRARKASPTAETLYLDDFYSRSAVPSTSGYSERLVVSTGGHSVAELVRDSGGTPATTYLHEDRLGSVEVVTDDSGAVLERRDYEAFGKRRSVTGPGANTRGDFTGHELDAEFGLINMKARLYDPAIGRFIMPDPVIDQAWHSEGPNAYSYVGNNPVNSVDPTGQWEICVGFCIGQEKGGSFGVHGGGVGLFTNDGGGIGIAGYGKKLHIATGGALTGGMAPGGFGDSGAWVNDDFGLSGGYATHFRASDSDILSDGSSTAGGCDELNPNCGATITLGEGVSLGLLGGAAAVGIGMLVDQLIGSLGGGAAAESAADRVARTQAQQYGSVTARDPGLIERFFGVQPWQRLDATMMDWFDWGTGRALDLLMAGVIGPEEAAVGGAEVIAERAGAEVIEGAVSQGARTEARNLAEQLTLKEAEGGGGSRIMQGRINDPKFPEDAWAKMQHVHTTPEGTNIVVHYWERLSDAFRTGFKFKD